MRTEPGRAAAGGDRRDRSEQRAAAVSITVSITVSTPLERAATQRLISVLYDDVLVCSCLMKMPMHGPRPSFPAPSKLHRHQRKTLTVTPGLLELCEGGRGGAAGAATVRARPCPVGGRARAHRGRPGAGLVAPESADGARRPPIGIVERSRHFESVLRI